MMKKIIKFWSLHWISIWDKKFRRWFLSKIWLWVKKKRRIIEKITKSDHIFDIKNYVLSVVYDETESLSNKFVILQIKKECQFFSNLEIVDRSTSTRNEFINLNIRSIASNVLSLITQKKIRFSFDLKDVFLMTRRKASNKRSKD